MFTLNNNWVKLNNSMVKFSKITTSIDLDGPKNIYIALGLKVNSVTVIFNDKIIHIFYFQEDEEIKKRKKKMRKKKTIKRNE